MNASGTLGTLKTRKQNPALPMREHNLSNTACQSNIASLDIRQNGGSWYPGFHATDRRCGMQDILGPLPLLSPSIQASATPSAILSKSSFCWIGQGQPSDTSRHNPKLYPLLSPMLRH